MRKISNPIAFASDCVMVFFCAELLLACSPPPPSRTVETTISADGQVIAALTRRGADVQRLHILNLNNPELWQELPLPKFTASVRFGMEGHNLLLTHAVPTLESKKRTQLTRWNLDRWQDESQAIYQAEVLVFPIEISPGVIMVRTREPNDGTTQRRYTAGHYWITVDRNGKVANVGPKPILPFSQPDIVGTGGFWFDSDLGVTPRPPRQRVISFALPGGALPVIDETDLPMDTENLTCDYSGQRCIRLYVANLGAKYNAERPGYIYKLQTSLNRKQWCDIPNVDGYMDRLSITPGGSTAVTAVAYTHDKPRTVVALHFKADQCEATSIQHISFKEQ